MFKHLIFRSILAAGAMLPCAASAQNYRSVAASWRNGSDLAVYGDLLCIGRYNLGSTYPDDLIQCIDQNGNTSYSTSMLGGRIIGLGTGARIWNVGVDNNLYAEISGQKTLITAIPTEYGNIKDMVISDTPRIVTIEGRDVVLNSVVVSTTDRYILIWTPGTTSGWSVIGGNDWTALTSHWWDALPYPSAVFVQSDGKLWYHNDPSAGG